MNNIATRAADLCKQIAHHDRLYHEQDAPEISDLEYDQLVAELRAIYDRSPELATASSPIEQVGGKASADFDIVRHDPPLLSLDKVQAKDAAKRLPQFFSRIEKAQGNQLARATPKLDGLAVVLHYEDGELVCAATRGDGREGENITANIKLINGVPSQIADKTLRGVKVQVRGEAVISRENFSKLQGQRERAGEELFSNPRNAAAGLVRSKDSNTDLGYIDFVAYSLLDGRCRDACNQIDQLKVYGFGTPKQYLVNGADEFFEQVDLSSRTSNDYNIDGWVFQIVNTIAYEKLGNTARAPRGAVAYKFEDAGETTILEDVELQVGRTGVVTPVAVLKGVSIGGVVVRKATLHNFQHVDELGIAVGDEVEVIRSGDVIPKITRVVSKGAGREPIERPQTCPSCSTALVPSGADLRCISHDCFDTRLAVFKHFVSRAVFNIKGIGERTLVALLTEGVVQYPTDLFRLTADDIAHAESNHIGGEPLRSAQNKAAAIEKAKKTTLDRVIASLGIPGLGSTASKEVAKREDALEFLRTASVAELTSVKGLNRNAAENVRDYFRGVGSPYTSEGHTEALQACGVEWEATPSRKAVQSGILTGIVVLVTGALESLTREEVKELIEEHGGTPAASVSRKVDLLVVGERPGASKLAKAEALGLKQEEGEEFLRRLGGAYA